MLNFFFLFIFYFLQRANKTLCSPAVPGVKIGHYDIGIVSKPETIECNNYKESTDSPSEVDKADCE